MDGGVTVFLNIGLTLPEWSMVFDPANYYLSAHAPVTLRFGVTPLIGR